MHRRQFLGGALGASLLPWMAGSGPAFAAVRGRLLPPPLQPGDTVGLVSPSSATDDSFSLQLAREAMEALGMDIEQNRLESEWLERVGRIEAKR